MKFFRLLFRRSLRIWAISVLAVSVFLFGHFMTPRGNDALAKVFLTDVGGAMSHPGMPEYMRLVVEDDTVQEVYFNGNQLFYTLNRTEKNFTQLIDYYANLYQGEQRQMVPPEAKARLLKTIKDPGDRTEHARRIDETEKILNQRYVSFEDENYAAFATVVTGKEGKAEWQKDMVERITSFKDTGDLTDLGDPKIMVAFKDPSQGDVQYFNVWPGAEFDMKKARPRQGEDAAGYDIEDIERPYDSVRMATFGQDHGGVSYEILVYRNDGRIVDALEHWYTAMINDEWAVSESFEGARAAADDEQPGLLFGKDNREVFISLREADGHVTSTLVVHSRS